MTITDLATISGVVLAYIVPLVGIYIRMESRFTRLEISMGISNGNVTPLTRRVHDIEMTQAKIVASCRHCGSGDGAK